MKYIVYIWHKPEQTSAASIIANGIHAWYQNIPHRYRPHVSVLTKNILDVTYAEWKLAQWSEEQFSCFPNHIQVQAKQLFEEGEGQSSKLSQFLYVHRLKTKVPLLYETQCHHIVSSSMEEQYRTFLPSSCVLYGKETSVCQAARAYYNTYFPFVRFVDTSQYTFSPYHVRLLLQESDDGFESLRAKGDMAAGKRKSEICEFWKEANREEGTLALTSTKVEQEVLLRPYLLRTPFAVNEQDERVIMTYEEEEWKRLFPRKQRRNRIC